jgi:tol-pal system protein YbgF
MQKSILQKALLLALALGSAAASAQVPVTEAGGASARAAQPAGNEIVVTLYNQLEALQQEVQTLRGLVEEQSYQIRRMQTEQRDRYLDIDRRLSELAGTATAGVVPAPALSGTPTPANQVNTGTQTTFNTSVPPVATTASQPRTTTPLAATPPATDPATAQMDEQELYRTALNLLLEQSQYEESIRLFQSYIDRFPQGRLLTNAYYWQGEALILVSRFTQAKDVFTRLITNYPQDPKAAGAMLKLGVVYQQMGDSALAVQTWQEIATRYPENVTEIRAAQDYMNRQ